MATLIRNKGTGPLTLPPVYAGKTIGSGQLAVIADTVSAVAAYGLPDVELSQVVDGQPGAIPKTASGGSSASVGVAVDDYGALHDGSSDDGPAFRAAWAALQLAGGGKLLLGPYHYLIKTLVDFSATVAGANEAALTIEGQGSATQVTFNVGATTNGWVGNGLGIFEISGITFLGRHPTADLVDCQNMILAANAWKMHVHDCQFYSVESAGSIIRANSAVVEDCEFKGCSAGLAVGPNHGACVDFYGVGGGGQMVVRDTTFVDYGNYASILWSRTPIGCYNWIRVYSTGFTGGRADYPHELQVTNCGFDEGANAIDIRGSGLKRATVRGCNNLIQQVGGGYFFAGNQFDYVELTNNRVECNLPATDPVNGSNWLALTSDASGGGTLVLRGNQPVRVATGKCVVLLGALKSFINDESDVDLVNPNTFFVSVLTDSATWRNQGRSGRYVQADGSISQYDAVAESAVGGRCKVAPAGSDPGVFFGIADEAQTDGRYLRVVSEGVTTGRLDSFGAGLVGVQQQPLGVSLAQAGRLGYIGRCSPRSEQVARTLSLGIGDASPAIRLLPRVVPAPAADGYDLVDRANSAVSAGTATDGVAWAAGRGTWGVNANAIYLATIAMGVGGEIFRNCGIGDNVDFESLMTWDDGYALYICADGAPLTDYYVVLRSGLNFQLASVVTTVTTYNQTFAAPAGSFPGTPARYCFARRGRVLSLWKDGINLFSRTDNVGAQPTSDKVGMGCYTLSPVGKFANIRCGVI